MPSTHQELQGIENPEVDLTHEGPVSRIPKAPSTYAWQKRGGGGIDKYPRLSLFQSHLPMLLLYIQGQSQRTVAMATQEQSGWEQSQ